MSIDLSSLPQVPIRILVAVIFVLTSWACLGTAWVGLSYILSNYFIVILGLWSERDNPSPIPVQFFFFGIVFTFLNDILTVSINYTGLYVISSTAKFNAAMLIILIIVKPVLGLFAYKEWLERVTGGGQHDTSNYEDLNRQSPGGYSGGPPPHYQPPNSQPFP